MGYHYVIWDLDGTLLDTSQGIEKSLNYTVDEMGFKPLPLATKRQFIGPPIYDSFRQYYNINKYEALKATEIFRNVYKNEFLFDAKPYCGIYEALEVLKSRGYKMSVATNKRNDYAQKLLKQFKFDNYFDYMLGSDFMNKMTKKDIIEKCLDFFKITDQNSAVMIGDTKYDYIGASNCGIGFIGVSYGFGFSNEEGKNNLKYAIVSTPKDVVTMVLEKESIV